MNDEKPTFITPIFGIWTKRKSVVLPGTSLSVSLPGLKELQDARMGGHERVVMAYEALLYCYLKEKEGREREEEGCVKQSKSG